MRALACTTALVAAAAVTAGAARAEGGAAQTQFDYGLAEMQAGRYATGCPALAESYRLDPHPGVLFTLAECENRWGKLASALTHYGAYLDVFEHMSPEQKALQRGRDKVSLSERERLRREVPVLTVSLPRGAPVGTAVTRDGVRLAGPSLGVALPVDPGEHVVVAVTPDGAAHEARVALAAGERRAVELDLERPPERPSERGSERPAAAAPAQPATTGTPPSGPSPRAWAWVSGAVGLSALAVGAVAGGIAMGDKATVDAHCRPDDSCDPVGLDAARHARVVGLVSDVAFGVGAAGLATAVVLWLVSPTSAAAPRSSLRFAAELREHGAIVGLGAAW